MARAGQEGDGNTWEGGVLVGWDWWTVEFGDAHAVGVLVGGDEPGPAYVDVGSGSDVPSTTHWSAYDGQVGRPRAEALRAVCACGWRGAAEYPLDWATVGDRPLRGGCRPDRTARGLEREPVPRPRKAAPLPEPLAALLVEITEQLTTTTADAPLAALRAAGMRPVTRRSTTRPGVRCRRRAGASDRLPS
ncbi:hypothetical protein [Streptomyces yangpuensis]|uniref:hypothetical protein n=1 Tax=Streptomyces yangpuensis TaxID=1648182 RepID=UPI00370FABBC